MSADIGPGDYVECVDASPIPTTTILLVQGGVYRVSRLGETIDGPGVSLCEFPEPELDGTPALFAARRFRPIYRPKSSLIEDLSRPVETEPA